ncbi:MAG: flagellar hook protein FlgE [Myxococcales bacterium]|nr:flagellar hook protein FlgE [Myxococcales bacterium]
MGLLGSLFSGVSGLTSNGDAISVVSNNIANANTIGFKAAAIEFRDVINPQKVDARLQIGRGVKVRAVQPNFDQGGLQGTGKPLDLAVQGTGMFIVRTPQGTAYTRAGGFSFDASGNVVDASGSVLQGFGLDAQGNPTSVLQDLNFAAASAPPRATTDGVAGPGVHVSVNLDAGEAIDPAAFSLVNPTGTSEFSTTLKIFDSLGSDHDVTIYFKKTGANTWDWYSAIDGGELDNDRDGAATAAGTPVVMDEGTITFAGDGSLVSQTLNPGNGNAPYDWDFAGGATSGQHIGWSFEDSTQYASPSVVEFASQDGRSSGGLLTMGVNAEGIITGLFSNGTTEALAQVALADFPSLHGLSRGATGAFIASLESGDPIIGSPNVGKFGAVVSESLELSNVDIAEQFVQLIQFQRGFQSSSRIITATDQLLGEVVNLVR